MTNLDTVRTLDAFTRLDAHEVTIWTDHVQDVTSSRTAGRGRSADPPSANGPRSERSC